MTPQGIRTVARQEFRLRIRAGRWKLLLLAWFVLLLLFTALATAAAGELEGLEDDGVVVYGALTLFVLGLALLVVPSLAAQSVNGDRERGTLAALQVTRLTPGDITMGKFGAAWGTALAFLALSLPMVLFTLTQGGVGLGRIIVLTTVVGLVLGTVCAISLYLSAALSRTTTSGVLSYLAVGGLTIGTLIAFGLGSAASTEDATETSSYVICTDPNDYSLDDGTRPLPDSCTEETSTYQVTRVRTDRIWWLLAPNPFVVVADAAPSLGEVPSSLNGREARNAEQARQSDVLGQLGREIRLLRRPPAEADDTRVEPRGDGFLVADEQPADLPAVWPWGLAFDVLLGAGALALTARRLRTPTRTLPKGQRVA